MRITHSCPALPVDKQIHSRIRCTLPRGSKMFHIPRTSRSLFLLFLCIKRFCLQAGKIPRAVKYFKFIQFYVYNRWILINRKVTNSFCSFYSQRWSLMASDKKEKKNYQLRFYFFCIYNFIDVQSWRLTFHRWIWFLLMVSKE